jgi:hypothetical protein
MRVPISSFKPMFGTICSRGRQRPVTMLYFIADDVNCRLRIDGFSIVGWSRRRLAASKRSTRRTSTPVGTRDIEASGRTEA